MKKLFLSYFFCVFATVLFAQNGYNTTTGARGLGMGESTLGLQDIDAAFSNQAGLAYLESFGAAAAGERRFALNELGTYGAVAALPTKAGTFGLHIQYFGFADFNEQKIGLAYARKLGAKLSVGAQLSYLNTRIELYGNNGLPVAEIGLQAEVIKNIIVGTHLVSPFRAEITEGENLPTVLRIGVTWRASEQVLISVQGDKDIDYPVIFRSGLEYKISDLLRLRAGVATNPTKVSFGFGLQLESGLGIDIASAYHQILGLIPGVGVKYTVN